MLITRDSRLFVECAPPIGYNITQIREESERWEMERHYDFWISGNTGYRKL